MVFHRDQAQFDRASWRKALLFPLWLAQIVLLFSLVGIFSYRLADTVAKLKENEDKGNVPMVELVWECTNVGFSLLSLLLNTIEIAKLVSETLTPFTMVFTHVLKMVLALAILALDILVYVQHSEGNWSLVGLAIDCALLFVACASGLYAVVTFRRLQKYDDYHHPANVKHFGFASNEAGAGGGSTGGIAGPHNTLSTKYESQTRVRSVSAASFAPSFSSTHRDSVTESQELSGLSRRESYNHKRDTQFEDYVSRRASANLKDDIDRAIGAEFGWGSGGRTSMERSASVVGTGVVASARAQAGENDGSWRTKSWASENGLVAVPEGVEEHPEDGTSGVDGHRRVGSDDDRELLLGRQESLDEGQEVQADGSAPPAASNDNRKRRRES